MKLIRYNTFDPAVSFDSLREEIDRFFGYALPGFRVANPSAWSVPCPVNLYREKDRYILRAELPGFDKKDLSLEVVDGSLVLSGHSRRDEKKTGEAGSSEARFTRTVPLPDEVDAGAVKAEYENGILTVTLPKRAEARPRQISIDVK